MRKFGMSGSSMKEERSGRAEEVRFLTTLMKCDYMLPKIVFTRNHGIRVLDSHAVLTEVNTGKVYYTWLNCFMRHV